MNPLFWTILCGVVIIPLLVIGCIILLKKLKESIENLDGSLNSFKASLPQTTVIKNMNDISGQLARQLDVTTGIISETPEKLDNRVSTEIIKGIDPLIKNMNALSEQFHHTHNIFQQIIMNIAEQGYINEIAATLSEATIPFKQLCETLHQNDHSINTILENTSHILNQWAEQRYVFEDTYENLAKVLMEWTQKDQIHRGEIEKRLFDRLAQLGELESSLIDKFGELKTASLQSVTASEIMQSNINEIVDHFKDIADNQKNISQTQIQSAQDINEITKRLDHVLSGHKQHVQNMNTLFETLDNQQNEVFGNIHTYQKKMIDNMEAQNKQILSSMKKSHEMYTSFLKTYQQKLPMGANEKQQKIQTALLISIVAINFLSTAILIYVGLK